MFEEVGKSQTGFDFTPEMIAEDLRAVRNVTRAAMGESTLVFGSINQDAAPQTPSTVTDAEYNASAQSVDVVGFSFYVSEIKSALISHTEMPRSRTAC
jgi:hypothetical protein